MKHLNPRREGWRDDSVVRNLRRRAGGWLSG